MIQKIINKNNLTCAMNLFCKYKTKLVIIGTRTPYKQVLPSRTRPRIHTTCEYMYIDVSVCALHIASTIVIHILLACFWPFYWMGCNDITACNSERMKTCWDIIASRCIQQNRCFDFGMAYVKWITGIPPFSQLVHRISFINPGVNYDFLSAAQRFGSHFILHTITWAW